MLISLYVAHPPLWAPAAETGRPRPAQLHYIHIIIRYIMYIYIYIHI